jgi:hypothetical protein
VDGRAVSGRPEDLLRSDDPRIVEFLAAESSGPAELPVGSDEDVPASTLGDGS